MAKITVRDTNVTVILLNENDYICLTDIARYKSDDSNAGDRQLVAQSEYDRISRNLGKPV